MKTGIYFNTTFDDYRAIPALSRSFAEDLLFDPSGEEAHFRLKNPIKPTPAMDLGTAIHSILLEPETFEDHYAIEPTPSDEQFAGKKILYTIDDLKPLLDAFGLKKSGKKEELIASLKEYLSPAEYVIWDDVMANFKREVEVFKKKILDENQAEIVFGLRDKMNQSQEIRQIFSGGYPEVTLVWKDRETGILCKCRLDYLRHDAIGEVKSFSVKGKKMPLIRAMQREIENNRYNFQFAIYLNALEQLIEEINAGKSEIFGEIDEDFKKNLLATTEKRSFIAFFRTAAPFQIHAFEVQKKSAGVGSDNAYFSVAESLWRKALGLHVQILNNNINKSEISTLEDHHVQGVRFQELEGEE